MCNRKALGETFLLFFIKIAKKLNRRAGVTTKNLVMTFFPLITSIHEIELKGVVGDLRTFEGNQKNTKSPWQNSAVYGDKF